MVSDNDNSYLSLVRTAVASLNYEKTPDSLLIMLVLRTRFDSGAGSKSTFLIRFLMSASLALFQSTPPSMSPFS